MFRGRFGAFEDMVLLFRDHHLILRFNRTGRCGAGFGPGGSAVMAGNSIITQLFMLSSGGRDKKGSVMLPSRICKNRNFPSRIPLRMIVAVAATATVTSIASIV